VVWRFMNAKKREAVVVGVVFSVHRRAMFVTGEWNMRDAEDGEVVMPYEAGDGIGAIAALLLRCRSLYLQPPRRCYYGPSLRLFGGVAIR